MRFSKGPFNRFLCFLAFVFHTEKLPQIDLAYFSGYSSKCSLYVRSSWQPIRPSAISVRTPPSASLCESLIKFPPKWPGLKLHRHEWGTNESERGAFWWLTCHNQPDVMHECTVPSASNRTLVQFKKSDLMRNALYVRANQGSASLQNWAREEEGRRPLHAREWGMWHLLLKWRVQSTYHHSVGFFPLR